jgi:hypothetical protein
MKESSGNNPMTTTQPPVPAFDDSWETISLKLAETNDRLKDLKQREQQYRQALIELWERGEAPTKIVLSNHEIKIQQGARRFSVKEEFKKQYAGDKATIERTYIEAGMAEMVQSAPSAVVRKK